MFGVCSICTQSVPNQRSREWSVPNLYPHEMSSTSVITGNGLLVTGGLAFYPFKLSSRNGLKLSVEHMPLSLTTIYHYPGTRSISATRSTIRDNALSVRLEMRNISIIHTGCHFENNNSWIVQCSKTTDKSKKCKTIYLDSRTELTFLWDLVCSSAICMHCITKWFW